MPRIILGLFIYLAHSLTSAYASNKLNHQDGDGPQKRPLGGVGRNRADVEHMHGEVLKMDRATLALKVVYLLTQVVCCDLIDWWCEKYAASPICEWVEAKTKKGDGAKIVPPSAEEVLKMHHE